MCVVVPHLLARGTRCAFPVASPPAHLAQAIGIEPCRAIQTYRRFISFKATICLLRIAPRILKLFALVRCVSNGYTSKMLRKDVGLRIRVEQSLREEFLEVCRAQDKPAAQVIREFMREYVEAGRQQNDDSSRDGK